MAIDPLSLDFGRNKRFCVYVYFDPRPRKKRVAIYVGKGLTATRPDLHWKRRAINRFFKAVLDKIRAAGLAPIVEIVQFFDTEEQAFACEKVLIAQYGRRSEGNGTLCNLTIGGDGVVGHRHSPESKAKISAASRGRPSPNKGRKASEETRAKLSEGVRNRGPEWREKMRKATAFRNPEVMARIIKSNTGRPRSAEGRANMSKAQKERVLSVDAKERIAAAQRGRQPTPETLAKMSAASRNAWQNSPKMAAAHRGQTRSAEVRETLRIAHLGIKPTIETRAKMSAAMRRRWSENEERQKLIKRSGHTAQGRENMRKAALKSGHIPSPEAIAKAAQVNSARTRTPEEREKRAASARRYYQNASPEQLAAHRAAISKGSKGREG